jgi:hypothetical protein
MQLRRCELQVWPKIQARVKVEVKVRFTLEQTTKTQRGNRGIALLFFNLGAKWGGWSRPRPCRFTPGKGSVFIV